MAGITPGQHTFTVNSADVKLPRGVDLVRAIPSQIRMNFDSSATRTVPVEVRFAEDLPPDLELLSASAQPAKLAITGPASRVAHVDSVYTDPLPVRIGAGAATYHSRAYVDDPRVRFEESPQVTVKVIVGKR
jgi:hypothetical protein